jgi:lysophospholipase L1-like esterase
MSFVFSLLVLEAMTRVAYSQRLDFQIEMSRYASTIKRPAADPRMTHEHIPRSRATLMGVPVAINSLGFRSPEIAVAKPAGTYRIVLVGDSLTFGWGVRAEDGFAEVLSRAIDEEMRARKSATAVQVVNTGIGNYNTSQQLALFENAARRLDPDVVILNYYINDAEPTPTERLPYAVSYSYLAMWLWGRLDTLSRMMDRAADYKTYYSDLYSDGRQGFAATRQALAAFGQLSREDDFRYIVAILPELHSVAPTYEFTAVHDKVRVAAQSGGADSVADLVPFFAGERPDSLWVSPDDAHPNAKGHAIIARGLMMHLREIGEIDRMVRHSSGDSR